MIAQLKNIIDIVADKAIFRGLIGLVIALLLLSFTSSYPERSLHLGPTYDPERSSLGEFSWLSAETNLSFQSPEIGRGLIIRKRLLAGFRLEDSRDLTIRSGDTTSVFQVEGGAEPRLYSYLLPMDGHYLEASYSISGLPTTEGDRRSLGLALFSIETELIRHPYWLDLRIIILGLLPPLLLLIGGKSGFLLVAFIIAIYLREPSYLLSPRFWAEEGQIYFSYAYRNPWYLSLFSPHLGYFSLLNNIAVTLGAHAFPLWISSSITTFIAFCIQIIPSMIVIYGQSFLWDTRTKKVIVVLLLLFAPITQELWLNTISSQFHLSLITLLLVIEHHDKLSVTRAWLYRCLIVIAGLTGVLSCILTPIFILKSFLYRNRESTIQACLLAACTIIQASMLGYSVYYSDIKYARLGKVDIRTIFATIETKTFLLPLLGEGYTDYLADLLRSSWSEGYYLILSYVAIISLITLIAYIFWGMEKNLRYLFLTSYLLLTVVPIFISVGTDKTALIGGFFSYRYFYVPTIILQLTLVYNIFYYRKIQVRPIICTVILSCMLATSIINYPKSNLIGQAWPTWEIEASKWQANSSYNPLIWPATWDMKLSGENNQVGIE
jgi:hypothetical protein